jgi:glycosyltransferase involved in cell wall biosynthesis
MKPQAFFEIGPLFEHNWTGIPIVTAGLAEQALQDISIDWQFFYHSLSIPRSFLEGLLRNRTGLGAHEFLLRHVWDKHDILFDHAKKARGFFCNIKPVRNFFAEEAIFVHDLSPLLTPQFHAEPSIRHFADRFRYDVETSVRFFCNSRATRDDLVAYFGVNPAAAPVVPMGIEIDLAHISAAQLAASQYTIEPYVIVLGTLEPRKNGRIILRFLAQDPGFLTRFRVVFVGREGWLDENSVLLKEITKAGLPADRIIFTGYVSDAEKIAFLYNAAFCIYASFFEGYGLPVREAAILKKIIVSSDSSSLQEVAPERCFFFDPNDLDQFSRVMLMAEKRAAQLRRPQSLLDIDAELRHMNWEEAYALLAEWVISPLITRSTDIYGA